VDPNLIYSDPSEFTRQLTDNIRREMRAEMQTAAGGLLTPMASMAKSEAMRNPKRKLVWDRYAPQIEALVSRLPDAAKARPDIWDEAARMVAGEHLDDLARIRADEILRTSEDAGSLPTQAAPSAPVPDAGSPLAKLFSDRHDAVKDFIKDEIPLAKVRDHYRKMGYADDAAIAELLTARVARK